jgi:molybdopterin/thiamine biosynthesis adenylyltransferase/rhodanese-related sulfurtransferase
LDSNRYIRQTALKEFGPQAQIKLMKSRVLVIGAGGLGVPVLQYLNAMGVGTLGVVERDVVSISNLHRQVLYTEKDIGKSKLDVAFKKLKAQNSATRLRGYDTFLMASNALEIIKDYDIVIDASDNFPTRYLINDACVILKKPFVYGGLQGFEGQVSIFNFKGGPTYRCLFPNMPSIDEIPNCNINGVLGVLPGIVGNLQALETIKMITGIGEVLKGKLLLYNALDQSMQKITFNLQEENLNIFALNNSYGIVSASPFSEITVDELKQLINSQGSVQIIDVRTLEEFEAYKIPNSVHIPLNELENRYHDIDLKQPIYLICQSGKRSAVALEQLKNQFSEIALYSVRGGINTYVAVCS